MVLLYDEDLPAMARIRWRACTSAKSKKVYAITGTKERLLMHRLLMPGAEEVDHINGNWLDNRKENLRPATRSQHMMNCDKRKVSRVSSQFKGVSRNRSGGWFARIRKDYETRYLGTFEHEVAAAIAYDHAARECFGHFARLNFPYGAG